MSNLGLSERKANGERTSIRSPFTVNRYSQAHQASQVTVKLSPFTAHRFYSTTQRSRLRVSLVMLAPILTTSLPSVANGKA